MGFCGLTAKYPARLAHAFRGTVRGGRPRRAAIGKRRFGQIGLHQASGMCRTLHSNVKAGAVNRSRGARWRCWRAERPRWHGLPGVNCRPTNGLQRRVYPMRVANGIGLHGELGCTSGEGTAVLDLGDRSMRAAVRLQISSSNSSIFFPSAAQPNV